MFQRDLEPCTYLTAAPNDRVLAVGWLAAGQPFDVGPTPRKVYDRLIELAKEPWQPVVFAGVHECELCQFDGHIGSANVIIPSGRVLYVAPTLVTHYINCHHYRPPDVFQEAVLECPPMRSQEYRRLLASCDAMSLLRPAGT